MLVEGLQHSQPAHHSTACRLIPLSRPLTVTYCGESHTGLMEGPEGFDQTSGLWDKHGWEQVADLRKKLEKLTELRILVRSLGRAGGRGPKRRAPEEVS